jgi:hypothetical protein
MKFLACRYLTILSLYKTGSQKSTSKRTPYLALYIYSSNPTLSGNYSHIPTHVNVIKHGKFGPCTKWRATQISPPWSSIYGWPIKRSHFLWVVLLEVMVSCACLQVQTQYDLISRLNFILQNSVYMPGLFWPKKKGLRLLQRICFLEKNGPKLSYLKGIFFFSLKWPYLDHKFLHVASICVYILSGVSNNIYFSL